MDMYEEEESSGALRVVSRRVQRFLEGFAPYRTQRWLVALGVLFLYSVRVYLISGFYIVTYALAIYLLNVLIGFLSPIEEPDSDIPVLPVNTGDDEFKPFARRLPEFKCWSAVIKSLVVSLVCTFIPALDLPVFWPILVMYFCVLFALTMRQRIAHMIKYKYIPFSFGKKVYRGTAAETNPLLNTANRPNTANPFPSAHVPQSMGATHQFDASGMRQVQTQQPF
ncbi:MAG: hypothetical protein MHM6MM_005842 [Cercozoa sp. M6MM]